jgi:outer membrane receptor protein involved in Fe transport
MTRKPNCGLAGQSAFRNALVISLAILALPSAWPAAAMADDAETVTVTGVRPPEPVGNAAFSVIDIDQAQLSDANRLDAALEEQVPGLSLFRRTSSLSANPTTQGVSLRDIAPSGAGRALVLLDGIPMNDPFGNWVIWGALPYEDIASAEIVRGAGAGPYGSGALTGTINLDERSDIDGVSEADGSAGNLGTYRVGASGGTDVDGVNLFASASGEHSDGWIPVDGAQRGAADSHVWLNTGSASLRGQTQFDDVLASARLEYYDQAQGAGLVGAEAKTHGLLGSLTFADVAQTDRLGWRVQGWFFSSNLSNTSVSVAADRSTTTPANDQYATPALGLGMNAALLGTSGRFHWETGFDLRHDEGVSNEYYQYSGTAFLSGRKSGGQMLIGGLYGEGAYDWNNWLFTLGVRGDYWGTAQGHLLQYTLASGAVTTSNRYDARAGVVPTARLGARHDFSDDEFLRFSAYAGFRAPSLNELYRPFRVGNNVTEANATLSPEELYGVETGWGGKLGWLTWDTTAFFNQLHNAIGNVSIGQVFCGGNPCGILYERQNAGDVNALGVEGEATAPLTDSLALRGAFSVTDARFQDNARNLAGKRPAQSPRVVTDGGLVWTPWTDWQFGGDVRWVGAQFEDDQNIYRLGSAFVADLRAEWHFHENMSLIGEIDNVANAAVNTGETTFEANGSPVISQGAPRTFQIVISYAH